jgi:hypothetical protein
MKNIHVLPKDKPSRLRINPKGKLILSNIPIGSKGETQNIYITSDEKIKKGDWCINTKNNNVMKVGHHGHHGYSSKKIILTTDQELITDGVQAIDDEFLEWFVKNPSCEEVKIDRIAINCSCESQYRYKNGLNIIKENSTCHERNNCDIIYKIIIPKEEPYERTAQSISLSEVDKEEPKQETLEERFDEQIEQLRERGITITYVNGQETPEEFAEKEVPNKLDSVLAKITHQNDLGLSQWYEVVYYSDGKWCSYSGSKTFEDGERVVEWKYCKEIF